MLQELGYVFEILTMISAFTMTYLVLRNDLKNIGNRFMAIATAGIGLYAGGIFLYDIIGQEWAIEVFYRISLISLLIGTTFMYITMQIMVHSTYWLKDKWKWTSLLAAVAGMSIYIIIDDFYKIVSLDPMDTRIEFVVLMMVSLWVLIILVLSSLDLYFHGIRKLEKGATRKRMMTFESGLLINLLAVVFTAISNLSADETLGKVMDIIFFLTLAIGTTLMTLGFNKSKEERK